MSKFKGFGALKTPRDLVSKLEYDLRRMKEDPEDQYAAFDFFVTAEHIVDWCHPVSGQDRKRLRARSPLLRIVSHIANGAKHFETTAKLHCSVTDIDVFRWVEPGYFETGYAEEPLVVQLSPDEASQLGRNRIDLPSLAQLVFDFWDAELR